MYNTLEVEALKQALEQIRQGVAVFEEYCTEDCEHCPLYKENICGYHMEIDHTAEITDRLLNAYVDYHDGKAYIIERCDFERATGIDPAWYDFNEDRTKSE